MLTSRRLDNPSRAWRRSGRPSNNHQDCQSAGHVCAAVDSARSGATRAVGSLNDRLFGESMIGLRNAALFGPWARSLGCRRIDCARGRRSPLQTEHGRDRLPYPTLRGCRIDVLELRVRYLMLRPPLATPTMPSCDRGERGVVEERRRVGIAIEHDSRRDQLHRRLITTRERPRVPFDREGRFLLQPLAPGPLKVAAGRPRQ